MQLGARSQRSLSTWLGFRDKMAGKWPPLLKGAWLFSRAALRCSWQYLSVVVPWGEPKEKATPGGLGPERAGGRGEMGGGLQASSERPFKIAGEVSGPAGHLRALRGFLRYAAQLEPLGKDK